MSQYRYSKKDIFTKSPSVVGRKVRSTRLDREVVNYEVVSIRESINNIDNLLSQISELSQSVYDEIDLVNQSVEALEDQL